MAAGSALGAIFVGLLIGITAFLLYRHFYGSGSAFVLQAQGTDAGSNAGKQVTISNLSSTGTGSLAYATAGSEATQFTTDSKGYLKTNGGYLTVKVDYSSDIAIVKTTKDVPSDYALVTATTTSTCPPSGSSSTTDSVFLSLTGVGVNFVLSATDAYTTPHTSGKNDAKSVGAACWAKVKPTATT